MRERLLSTCFFVCCFCTAWAAQHPEGDAGWNDYGGNLAGQRYSAARELTPANVGELQVAWTFHKHALDTPSTASNSRASFEATPVLWNRTLFFDTPFDQIFAVDATNGALR